MLLRLLFLFFVASLPNGSPRSLADESRWSDGYCGSEAVRFTFNCFGISERTIEVRQLDTLESASIDQLRMAFESVNLSVKSYACKSVTFAAWNRLDSLVASGNAVVLVLAAPFGNESWHYFVLSNVFEGRLRLVDPRSGTTTTLDCSNGAAKDDKKTKEFYLVIIDHPDSSFLTRPPSELMLWLIMPCVVICLASGRFFARLNNAKAVQ